MRITPFNNTNFTSRNSTIRYADDMVRHVNNLFPRISSTLVEDYANAPKFQKVVDAIIFDNIFNMRTAKMVLFDDAERLIDAADAFILPVKSYKRGNCSESAALSAITAKVNGIKKAFVAKLFSSVDGDVRDQDHMVLMVEDKKPYVIDAWLGFADYLPEAFLRYKKEFARHFDIREGEKLFFLRDEDDYSKFLNHNFENAFIKEVLNRYPEIKMK